MTEQAPLYRPLRIFLHRQLFDFISLTCLNNVLAYAHGESEEANDTQHMIVVVHEPCLISEHHFSLGGCSELGTWFEELSLLDVTVVDFVKLPIVSVRLDDTRILNGRIDVVHVLQAPETSTHSLRDTECF